MTGVLKPLSAPTVRTRLLALTLVASGAALAVAAVVFTGYQVRSQQREMVREASAIADLLAHSTGVALRAGDVALAHDLIRGVDAEPTMLAAELRDAAGRPLAGFTADRPDAAGASGLFLDGPLRLQRAIPTPEGEARLTLVLSTEAAEVRVRQDLLVGLLVLLGATLLALLLTRRLQYGITGPIEALVSDEAAGADHDPGGDELERLQRSFGRLVDQIRRLEARRGDDYFRSLVENTAELVSVIDASGTLRYASPGCTEALGLPREQIMGRRMLDMLHPADVPRAEQALQRAMTEGAGAVAVDLRARRADGSWIEVEAVMRNELSNPAVNGVVMSCRDVSERRETERLLRSSERRYREVVENAADAFFLHDEHGRLLDVNRRACETLFYTREELMQMSVQDFEMNFARDEVDGIWERMEPGVPQTVNGRHRRKDGVEFDVEVRVGRYSEGDELRFVALARDVTERVRAEQALAAARDRAEAADRTKSVFLANVSHEIRTPITAVMSMAQLLDAVGEDRGEREHYLDVIRGSCDSLLSVIDGLLDIAKIESGTLTVEHADFDLHAVTEGVLDMLAATAHRKGLELVSLVDADVPRHLHGDAARIRQVLVNLVGNAVKFTDAGEIALHVSRRNPEAPDATPALLFEVSDTGIGLASDQDPELLFDPFVRGSLPAAHRHPGTGLGLAICKFIIEQMHGRIGVEANEGHGCRFWFELALPVAEARPAVHDTLAAGTRLLIVDANETARAALVEYARQGGMQATGAASASAALGELKRAAGSGAPVELALVDWRLGGVEGLALLQTLQSDPGLASTPVALLFPLGARVDPVVERLLGSYQHVAKPVRQSRFARLVASVLDRDHLSRQRRAPAPALEAPPPRQQPEATAAPAEDAAARIRPTRVLLAEDNELNREGLTLLLSRLDCEVDAVADGAQAVEALASGEYDVVFLDCQMPVMDGFEAARAIRANESGDHHVPIVALTANAQKGTRHACLEAGMDDYLTKPVTLDQLAQALGPWRPVHGEDVDANDTTVSGKVAAPQDRVVELPPEATRRLQQMFTLDAAERLDAMHEALQEKDTRRLAREAHLLAGSAAQVGEEPLLALCRELEQESGSADDEVLKGLLDRADAEYARVRSAQGGPSIL